MPRWLGCICLLLFATGVVRGAAAGTHPDPLPRELLVGRHTYFDSGPPFDFYELFFVRSIEDGTSIERLIFTPDVDPCIQPATLEVARASLPESLAELLDHKNPCSIPEKALRRERKRCKGCLIFSGANVVMRLDCGGHPRRIPIEVLDRDLFDRHPSPPEQTSWTMKLLARLDEAAGPGVMAKTMFALDPVQQSVELNTSTIRALEVGELDALFRGAPDKLSAMYAEATRVRRGPSADLVTDSPFRPTAETAVSYPWVAQRARIEARISFELTVTPNGGVSNLRLLNPIPLLARAVETGVSTWKFPPEAAGKEFAGAIEFKLNCPTPSQ